jgi:tight adherence protein C
MSLASLLAFTAAALAVAGIADLLRSRTQRATAPGAPLRALARLVPTRLRPPLDLAARIEAAGAQRLAVSEVMAVKVACASSAAVLAVFSAPAVPGRLGLLLLVGAPAAGFLAPDAWLARRIRERVARARRDLPALLDLLRVAIDAGLAPTRALAAVGERSDAPLAGELGAVAREVELGVPLDRALQRLARRVPAGEVRSFTAALGRAAQHGAPLGPTLAAQARDARLARARRIQESAAKAAPKIQLVVALLLVPSVLLIVAAALLSALLGGNVGSSIG